MSNKVLIAKLRDVAAFVEKEHGRDAAASCLATEAADALAEADQDSEMIFEHLLGLWPEHIDFERLSVMWPQIKDKAIVLGLGAGVLGWMIKHREKSER